MHLFSKYNKGVKFLLCVINIYSKYAWVVTLKDKERSTAVNAIQKIISNSKRTSKKMWIDQGSKFYNNTFKSWFSGNKIELHSTSNKGKPVITEKCI